MKKLVLGISTALLTIIMCMAFAGCAGKVKGKTYVYRSMRSLTPTTLTRY